MIRPLRKQALAFALALSPKTCNVSAIVRWRVKGLDMQNLLEAMTVSASIHRPWQELYDDIWKPTFFPKWASGLSGSSLEKEGNAWKAEGPEGPVRIRFTAHNDFGVMDHYVDVGGGVEVYIPLSARLKTL